MAQLNLGVRAGANLSDLKISSFDHPSIADVKLGSGLGWEAGFYARAKVLDFFVQPEIVLTQIYGDISILANSGTQQNETFQLNRMDVPIPLGFDFGPVCVYLGPVASFNLNSGASIYQEHYNQGTWSLLGGLGVHMGDFMVDLRYQSALMKFANQASINIDDQLYLVDTETRVSQFILSLGYTF